MASSLNTLAFFHKHQELVKINLNLLEQHIAPNAQKGTEREHSGEVGPGPQPGRGITQHYAKRR